MTSLYKKRELMQLLEELEREIRTLNKENGRLQIENAFLSVKLKLTQEEKQMHIDEHTQERHESQIMIEKLKLDKKVMQEEVQQVMTLMIDIRRLTEGTLRETLREFETKSTKTDKNLFFHKLESLVNNIECKQREICDRLSKEDYSQNTSERVTPKYNSSNKIFQFYIFQSLIRNL